MVDALHMAVVAYATGKFAQAAFIGICYNVMEEQGMGCPEGGTRVGLSKAACATGAMVAL